MTTQIRIRSELNVPKERPSRLVNLGGSGDNGLAAACISGLRSFCADGHVVYGRNELRSCPSFQGARCVLHMASLVSADLAVTGCTTCCVVLTLAGVPLHIISGCRFVVRLHGNKRE